MSPVKSPDEFSARDAQNKDKIIVEKDEAEELPPGWTKEVRTRKTGSRTKVDRYYTDPVTGYIFLSLKDVQRYLKTGELGRLAIKPKIDEKQKPSELKEQKSETLSHKRAPTGKSASPARASKRLAGGNSGDAPPPSSPLSLSPPEPKTRQATRLAGIKVDSPSLPQLPPEPKTRQATQLAAVTVDAPPTLPPEPKTRQARRLAGVTVDEPPLSPPEPKTRQATRQAGIKIDSLPPLPPDSKTPQATPVVGIETGTSPPSKPVPKTSQATPVMETETGTSPPSKPKPKTCQAKLLAASPQPKTRRATRQSGIKIDSPPPSPLDTRTSRQPTQTRPVNSTTPQNNNKKTEPEKPTETRNQNADMDANMNHNQENPIIPPSNQESNKNQIQATLEKQKSPVVNPTITNPVPQSDSSINFSMSDLWTDPCIEFAVKTLTGAIPFTDLNKVENFTAAPSPAPLQDIWTDPCIEFAVKTLTGAIPVTEDDYLPHRPSSSANPAGPHNFSSPMNVYQTGYSNKQQEPVFPTLGNGGLQKSGKFVNGTNGQCSRSRFYQ
ncbi:uncharacterized protein LOC143628103 [Bidens hawaiensis]|uniref:uncharacterized protein LOC143628103 n=1 Tax=Bidens hawaiensis TaxID=980011 RepID=UPI00404B692C